MTELEKLRKADAMIRDMTEGRSQIALSSDNSIYVRQKDDAYIGLNMIIYDNVYQNRHDIFFDANVRKMGVPMTAVELGKLVREVQQAHALMTALEMYHYHPTSNDLSHFRFHLLVQLHAPPQSEEAQMRGDIDLESVLEDSNGEVN